MSNMMGPRMGRPGEKPQATDFRKSIKELSTYSKKYYPAIFISIILAIAASVLSLIGPNMLSDITDIITEGMMGSIDTDRIFEISLLLGIIYFMSLVFGYGQGFIISTVSQKITRSLRIDLTNKIDQLPLGYFDTKSHGDTLSRVTNDSDTIGISLNQSLSSLIVAIFVFFGSIIMMFYTNWIMAIAAILSTVFGFVFMGTIMKKSQTFFANQQRVLGRLNGHIEESFTGHTIIKAYNTEDFYQENFEELNNKLFDNAWRAQFISGLMMPIMMFIGNFSYVVVCIVGALLALEGSITFGVIVAFMVYIRLFTQPLATIAQSATSLQSAAAASERVFEFLKEEVPTYTHTTSLDEETLKGDVQFKHVHFGYDESKIIINDFNASIKAGQKVAIVGPTGAGKTTLINLLMRFYELNSGEILIDNVSLTDVTHENIHNLFSMVLQDTWLFEGTVKENIIYNQKGISDEEVYKVCKEIGIHKTIKSLSHGYDTILNDKVNFSVGQKQLLTIARAMIKNSKLLILDEATSSVDTRTEVLIQKAMDTLSHGKTSFIIAHRLSTIKNADLILVMKDGDIIESGTHNELLALKGFYENLYNSQFETV